SRFCVMGTSVDGVLGPGAGGASMTTTSPSGTPSDVNARAFIVYPGGRLTGASHIPALRSGSLPSKVYRTIAVIVGGVASSSPSERVRMTGDWAAAVAVNVASTVVQASVGAIWRSRIRRHVSSWQSR